MARIQDINQEYLQSPAVGAPNIDNSGATVGRSLAQNFEQMATVKHERQALTDKITADAHANDFNLRMLEERNAIHKEFYGTTATPEQEVEAISLKAKQLQTEYAKTMATPGQKNAFALQSGDIIKNHQTTGYEQALTRQTAQTHQNSLNSLNSISDMNSNIWANPSLTEAQKYEQMHQQLDLANKTLKDAQKYLPAEQFGKLRQDFTKSFSKAAIFGAIQTDPEQAKKLLDDRVFENSLDTKEEVELKNYADNAIEKKEKERQLNLQYSNNQTVHTLWQGIHDGKTRMQDVEQAFANGSIKKDEKKALSELLFSKKLVDPTEKLDIYNKLNDEQNELFEKNDNGKGLTSTKEATLERISLLRQHVMEAERVGAITQAKAQSFYRATTPFLDEKAGESLKQSVQNRKTGFDFFGHWVGNYKIGTEQEQESAKAHLSYALSKQVDNAEANGENLTPAAVKDMAQTILKDYITQNYPQTINAKDVPNSIISAKGGPEQLHSMPADAAGSQKMKAKEQPVPKYDSNTQVLLKNIKTGAYKVIPK